MAERFGDRNNINLLYPSGQFGSRPTATPITRHIFLEADDPLLYYLNEEEPKWLLLIIPMVLVNGSKDKTPWLKSFVPKYNPRDIIANIQCLLNGEAIVPMEPWYKGFKGTIQKTALKETGYTTTGLMEVNEDENMIRITELPIRMWKFDYKKFLYKQPFIEKIMTYDRPFGVHYEVVMSSDQMSKAMQEGLLKKFKLTTTLSTSDMYLLGTNDEIKKYDTPEQILVEFFHFRLEYYKKRKELLVQQLQKELLKLENKGRFLQELTNGTFFGFNPYAELKAKGYPPIPEETSNPRIGYNYLLEMIVEREIKEEQLLAEYDEIRKVLNELTDTDPKFLWLRDLDALSKQLDEQDKRDAENEMQNLKTQEKAMDKESGGAWRVVTKTAAEDCDSVDDDDDEDESSDDDEY